MTTTSGSCHAVPRWIAVANVLYLSALNSSNSGSWRREMDARSSRRARDWLAIPLTIVVTAVGLLWGGHATYVAIRNPEAVELTCAEYLHHPPDAEWLRLRHCAADFNNMGVEAQESKRNEADHDPTAVYIPLRPEGVASGSARLVVRSEDAGLRRLVSRSYGAEREGRDPSPEDARADEAATSLEDSVEGVVELAVDRSAQKKAELRRLGIRLANDFAIIAHGERPRPLWLAAGVFAIGLGGLGLIVRRIRRRRRHQTSLARATVVAGS